MKATISTHTSQNTVMVECPSPFDSDSHEDIEMALAEIRKRGCRHIILNFQHITYIDSLGLGRLFLWYHRLQNVDIRLSLVSPQAVVRDLVIAAHLHEIIPVFGSFEEAAFLNESPPPISDGPDTRSRTPHPPWHPHAPRSARSLKQT
jgi:anti-sigma B factor antagonist